MNELNNKKGSISTVIIVVLLTVIIGLGFYVACDKGLIFSNDNNNEEINNNENSNNDNNVTEDNDDNNHEVEKVSVISAYSYIGQVIYNGNCISEPPITKPNVNVNIPKINSSKPNAISLNQKILNDFGRFTNLEKGTHYTDVVVNYSYLIKNEYLYIYIQADAGFPCGSGVMLKKSYYYDINNDKIMNNQEAFTVAGLTIDDLIDVGGSDFKSCELNSCGCGLKIEGDKLVPYYIDQCI